MSQPAPPSSGQPARQAPAGGTSVGSAGDTSAIDMQLLADKVYRLFLADLDLGRRRATGRKE